MPGDTIGFRLIVGLGNPGSKYRQTRHNAGFWFVDELDRRYSANLRTESKFYGDLGRCLIGGQDIYLLKPGEFMNLSGRSIATVAKFYKLPVEKMLLVHDELDLPPGQIRLKQGGGHGGHNGLRDSVQCLGARDFWRLRVGIGHPGHKSAVSGYVLKPAPADQQRSIDEALDVAVSEIERIVAGDINEATRVLHSHRPPA